VCSGAVAATGAGGSTSLRTRRWHVALLAHYVVILAAAEVLLAFANLDGNGTMALLGLLFDLFLVVSLPIEASVLVTRDKPLAEFLGALVLPPLIRVVTLSIPSTYFTTVEWTLVVSLPLLLAVAAVMQAEGLRRADMFLSVGNRRYLPVSVTLAFVGLGLGFAEYRILRPDPWIATRDMGQMALAGIAIFLSNGLVEELAFRGILLRTGIPLLGQRGTLLFGSLVYAALHIGTLSPLDIAFAFAVGLVFGVVVLLTRSLLGAIGAHTLASAALYLILPFGF